MLDIIKEAAINFCTHQIGMKCEIKDTKTNMRTLIAYIDIQTQDGTKYKVYIASDTNFMQRIAKLFLEENESDEDTLKDMTLEITNIIVGSAKIIAQETGIYYNIGTPHFEKIGIFDFKYDDLKVIYIEDDELIVAIKELDA